MSETLSREEQNLDRHGYPKTPYITAQDGNYITALPDFLPARDKSFSIKKYGLAEARDKAIRYRDQCLPKSHRAHVLRVDRANQNIELSPAGRTARAWSLMSLGRPGVEFYYDKKTGHDYATATARDHANEKNHTKRFRVNPAAPDLALLHAIRKRLGWERRFYGHRSLITAEEWLQFIKHCMAQFGTRRFNLDDLEYPGSISWHPGGYYKAYYSAGGKGEQVYFSVRRYSSAHEARVAAILYCINEKLRRNPTGRIWVEKPLSTNKTTGEPGVCRRIIRSGRNRAPRVIYEATVYIDGERRPIRFDVGKEDEVTPEQEHFALILACHCRQYYVETLKTGERFDRSRYKDWKRKYMAPAS